MSRSIRLITVIVFCLTLIAPAIVFQFRAVEAKKLEGVEQRRKAVALRWSTIVSGAWQQQTERTFIKRSPLFPYLVRSDNQLNLALFHQLSSNYRASVIVGRDDCLVERAYIREANKLGVIKPKRYGEIADNLLALQNLLARHGVGFLLVISPSKVGLYPECLPAAWSVPGRDKRKNKYETILPHLRRRNIALLDTHAYFAARRDSVPFRFYPKGGTHWGRYAACLAASEIGSKISQQLKRPLPQLSCDPPLWPSPAKGSELELAQLTNLWSSARFTDSVPVPREKVSAEADSFRPNVLFVGSSFMGNVFRYLDRNRLHSRRDFWYYFRTEHSWPRIRQTRIVASEIDWKKKVLARDIVVLEINEAFVDKVGFGFIEAALRSLPASAAMP